MFLHYRKMISWIAQKTDVMQDYPDDQKTVSHANTRLHSISSSSVKCMSVLEVHNFFQIA